MDANDKVAILTIALMIVLCALVAVLEHPRKSEMYPQTAIVVSTNESQNLLTLMTGTGHVFIYETPIEDWLPGDICSMIMDNRGTEDVRDDEIRNIRYSGRPEDYTYLPYDGKGMVN